MRPVDVGLIEAEEPPGGVETSVLLQSLRERAAQAGCDAVVVTSITLNERQWRMMYGTCIRYVAP